MTRYRFASLLLCLCLVLLAATSFAQGPPGGPPPPPPVTVITVEEKTVPYALEFVGVTEASRVVEIRARVQGFLESRDFAEGALVEADTQLFSIDPRSFKADLDIAKARVQQAEARLLLAEQEVKRLKSVEVPGAIAQSDLDKQVAEQVNAAAALRLVEAEYAKAELELSYTTISAPLTGLIGKALKEIGSLVDAGQNSLLAVMHQVDPLYASFSISEREYLDWQNRVASGELTLPDGEQPYLEIALQDGTVYSERGKIDFFAVDVDTQTGTVEIRGTFANPGNQLKPGQFVKAFIKGYERPKTISVPQRAVGQSPQGTFVYVLGPENKAEFRIIKPGAWTGSEWVVEQGIQPGERVLTDGLVKVMPGAVVNPDPQGAAAPPAPAAGQE